AAARARSEGLPDRGQGSPALLQKPRVRLKIADGADDPVADRHRRPPPQRADAGAIEKDERTVADPAALAAGVVQTRRNAQLLANPTDRIADLAVVVVAEVVHADTGGRLRNCQQNRLHAIADVQVRLPLLAVAEHPQRRRIAAEALDEIEHVPVRIAFAQERDETKDGPLEAERRTVRLHEPFAGQLR